MSTAAEAQPIDRTICIPCYLGRQDDEPIAIDLAKPDLAGVPWMRLCRTLCNILRFNGSTSPTISVAGHSMWVANQLPKQLVIYGLLHDMHEALMGDITRPVRRALELHGPAAMVAFNTLEQSLMAAVHKKAQLPWPLSPSDQSLLNIVDNKASKFELEADRDGRLSERYGTQTLSPHPRQFHGVLVSELAFCRLQPRGQKQRWSMMPVYNDDDCYFFQGHLSLHPSNGVKFTNNTPRSVAGGTRVMAIEIAVPKVVFQTPTLSATITVQNNGAAAFEVDAQTCSEALKAVIDADVTVRVSHPDGEQVDE